MPVVLPITYSPERKHIIGKNDVNGAWKIYFKLSSHSQEIADAVERHDTFIVYHRKDNTVNFAYLGCSDMSMYFQVESEWIVNVFLPPEMLKTRTLYASPDAYLTAVAKETGYKGDLNSSTEYLIIT